MVRGLFARSVIRRNHRMQYAFVSSLCVFAFACGTIDDAQRFGDTNDELSLRAARPPRVFPRVARVSNVSARAASSGVIASPAPAADAGPTTPAPPAPDAGAPSGQASSYRLTVRVVGQGRVTSQGSPAAIDCGSSCSAMMPARTSILLYTRAEPGYRLDTFSGDCSGGLSHYSGGTAYLTHDDSLCTVTFVAARQRVNVEKVGTGAGSVVSEPAGLDCGAACSMSFPASTGVVLSARAEPGSVFAGWDMMGSWPGTCTDAQGRCSLFLTYSYTIKARFDRVVDAGAGMRTLTVGWVGRGGGSVASEPAGVVCAQGCSRDHPVQVSFPVGARVVLRATPAAGSFFAQWMYGQTIFESEPDGSYVVVMNEDLAITAVFQPR